MIIFSDFDGVLTPSIKTYEITDSTWGPWDLTYKHVSSHDAMLFDVLRHNLVILSKDPRNRAFVESKGIRFLHAQGEKYPVLQKFIDDKMRFPVTPRYAYIGDTMQDFECLEHSTIGFIPSDASFFLEKKVVKVDHVYRLNSCGGRNCLEEALYIIACRADVLNIHGTDLLKRIEGITS